MINVITGIVIGLFIGVLIAKIYYYKNYNKKKD